MRGLEVWMIAAIVAVVVVAVVAGLLLLKKPTAPEKPKGPGKQPQANKTQPGGKQAGGGQPAGEEKADKITVVTTEDKNHKIYEDPSGYWGIDKVGLAIEGDKFTLEVLVKKETVKRLAEATGADEMTVAEYLRDNIARWLMLAGENIKTERISTGNKYYKIIITGTVKDAETLKKIAENIVAG